MSAVTDVEIIDLCPATPRELDIDKDAWWPGQRETIAQIIHAFTGPESRKFVVAAVPTGGGKTIIAAAVQRLLARHGLNRGSVALTHTIALEHQYQRTLTEAKVMTGRNNWACELPPDDIHRLGFPDLTAADAPCVTGDCPVGLKGRNGCVYYRQWWEAADAPMVVMNYALALRLLPRAEIKQGNDAIPNPFRRSLLVADECHLAHDAIVGATAIEISFRTLAEFDLLPPADYTRIWVQDGKRQRPYENVNVWIAWAKQALSILKPKLDTLQEERRRLKASPNELKKLQPRIKRLRTLVTALSSMITINPEEWLITRTGKQALVQSIWGWKAAQERLWQHFDRVLLMSATPGDPVVLRLKLGIDKDDMIYIERPSTFPVENRPIYVIPVVHLRYDSDDSEWEKMAKAIIQISKSPVCRDRKGLVHSGSAANATKLTKLLNRLSTSDRFFSHGKGHDLDREEAIERFANEPGNHVLVTASFTTGIDLPFIIGWQVIAKIPFPSLADDLVAKRRSYVSSDGFKFGQYVYQADTMNTVIQAAGRIVRGPTDEGPTFILDANYRLLLDAYKPVFYTEAVQRPRPVFEEVI